MTKDHIVFPILPLEVSSHTESMEFPVIPDNPQTSQSKLFIGTTSLVESSSNLHVQTPLEVSEHMFSSLVIWVTQPFKMQISFTVNLA